MEFSVLDIAKTWREASADQAEQRKDMVAGAASIREQLSEERKQGVRDDLAKEISVSAIARKFGTSRQTIMRVRDEDSRSDRA